MKLTIAIEYGNDGWLTGQLIEFPAVISQGQTEEELRTNLLEALELVLDYEREKAQAEGRELIDLVA